MSAPSHLPAAHAAEQALRRYAAARAACRSTGNPVAEGDVAAAVRALDLLALSPALPLVEVGRAEAQAGLLRHGSVAAATALRWADAWGEVGGRLDATARAS